VTIPAVDRLDIGGEAVLISSVPPLMMQTDANPGWLPKSVFDGLQAQLAANRATFYRDLPSGPFYGFNRPGVEDGQACPERDAEDLQRIPRGMPTTQAETINADVLAFLQA
jgi:hypothetical protein